MESDSPHTLSCGNVCRTILLGGFLLFLGCGPDTFREDRVLHVAAGLTAEQSASVSHALTTLLGTPEKPRVPDDPAWLDTDLLSQSAGVVASHTPGVTHGLWGRHCARCHGVTGDGRGPASRYQSPYPRDFRLGVFKWKSTYRDAKPTDGDLDHTIAHGVAGTAMPSFRLLLEGERLALREYVKHLAVRGQLERELVALVADELAVGEPLAADDPGIQELYGTIVARWQEAEERVVPLPKGLTLEGEGGQTNSSALPHPLPIDGRGISVGKALYHGDRAGCVKCHGPEGSGRGVVDTDYDAWTGPRVELAKIGSAPLRKTVQADLPAQSMIGQALKGAVLRGGSDSGTIFRRFHQGIAGTPMPAVAEALTDEEILDLIAYVLSLVQEEKP